MPFCEKCGVLFRRNKGRSTEKLCQKCWFKAKRGVKKEKQK